jgi:hypothetical protein
MNAYSKVNLVVGHTEIATAFKTPTSNFYLSKKRD